MKIVLSNYRYFISGGPERYLFSIKKHLESKGHSVISFSIRSPLNVENPYYKWFMKPINNNRTAYFDSYEKSISTYLKVFSRSFYSGSGFFAARELVSRFSPNIVYSLHFLNKMSPSIIDGFKSKNIPVVIRISDFNILCPQGHMLLNGKICEDCITGNLFNCFFNRCVKGSRIGSFIKSISWTFHRLIRVYKRVDAFICPSEFTRQKMIEGGIIPNKLFHIPTPTDLKGLKPRFNLGEYILYFGRISEEKGVDLLIKAYIHLPLPKPDLLIITNFHGCEPWINNIRKNFHQIKILPFQEFNKLSLYIKRALFVVVPSIWYENMPNTILEAFAHGKAVLCSNIGSLKELIVDGKTGLLFEPGDAEDLMAKMQIFCNGEIDIESMGRNARRYVEDNHSESMRYEKLVSVFNTLIS